jgi:hypothetical protein
MKEVRDKHKTATLLDKIGLIHGDESATTVYDHPHPGWLYLVDDSGSNRILIRNRQLLRDFRPIR